MTDQDGEYQRALLEPRRARYIKLLKLLPYDREFLWVADALALCSESESGERLQRLEAFYTQLLARLRQRCKGLQPNSLVRSFTQRPPAAVRRALHMCGYLGVDPSSPHAWLALVAGCLPVPENWAYD